MQTKFKGIKLTLGDKDFVVPPLSFRALQAMQAQLAEYKGGLDEKSMTTVIDAAHAAILRNYPEFTRDELLDLVDVGNMQEVMEAVMDVSGLKRKAQEAAAQAEAGDPSTGTSSTLS